MTARWLRIASSILFRASGRQPTSGSACSSALHGTIRFYPSKITHSAKDCRPAFMFGGASIVFGIVALGHGPVAISLFLSFGSWSVGLLVLRVRDYNKVTQDIDKRIVEVIEGAPEKVWVPRYLTRLGFCYIRLGGHTIRVPNELYGELRESNMVKVAFLPTALVAVGFEPERGIGRL